MVSIDVGTFKGEAPRIAPRLLPNDMGQNSANSRLLSGNLEPWKYFSDTVAQSINANPLTINYMNDQLWLTWNRTPGLINSGIIKLWDTALGTPFWNFQGSVAYNANSGNNLFPVAIGFDGYNYKVIDYKSATHWLTSGSVPPIPVGDGLVYNIPISGGGLGGTRAPTTAELALRGAPDIGAGGQSPGPFVIGSAGAFPFGEGFVMRLANGYCIITTNVPASIIGTTPQSSTAGIIVAAYDPSGNKYVYDIISALSGFFPGYVNATSTISTVYPCADNQHLLVLGNTGYGGGTGQANLWWILNCTSVGATVVATGPWTTGPEQTGGYSGVGASFYNYYADYVDQRCIGMLESDLSHLWMVSCGRDWYCLQLSNGNNYTTLYHGTVGGSTPWTGTAPAIATCAGTMWADNGTCMAILGNQAAAWSRGILIPAISQNAIEVDVAKEAIGGDVSYRTIFTGCDVPRFTDLGLASGLVDGAGNPITGQATLGPSGGPYPVYSRKLGVPNPTVAINGPVTTPAAVGSGLANISETFDNPTQWNLVSVPGVASSLLSVSGGAPSGSGGCLQTRGINYAEAFGWKTQSIQNSAPITMTVQFAVQRLAYDYLLYGYTTVYFSLDTGASGSCVELHHTATGVVVTWRAVNNGVKSATPIAQTTIASGSISTWATDADPNWTGAFRAGHWYTMKLVITPQSPVSTSSVDMTISDGTSVIAGFTMTQANMPNAGSGFGFGATQISGQPFPDWHEVWYDNLTLSGTGPAQSTANLEATSYVYTVVNDLNQESGPSPAMITSDGSGTIVRPIGQAVAVPLPSSLSGTGADASYFTGGGFAIPSINQVTGGPSPTMNVYRAVTGSTGTSFLLVAANVPFNAVTQVGTSSATIPSGFTSGIIDALPDASLLTALTSLLWNVPPTNMYGILALPNGIYAGFAGNQLCLSAQGIPHAWPISYRLTFDYDIVGIEAIDSTVVVCTKKFPYLSSGQTPDAYSQTKASYPYACASKQSIQFLKNVGVVYATYEGLVAIAGPGNEKLLTESLFSKDEWLALNPASMMAAINDNRYFCWYKQTNGTVGGFYIDVNAAGAGKCSLAFHAISRYNDPLTDTLYVVLDSNPTP